MCYKFINSYLVIQTHSLYTQKKLKEEKKSALKGQGVAKSSVEKIGCA